MEQNQNQNFYSHIFKSVFLLTHYSSVFHCSVFSSSVCAEIDQPQSASQESLLTNDSTLLFVQCFV